jgi:ribosomal protein S10
MESVEAKESVRPFTDIFFGGAKKIKNYERISILLGILYETLQRRKDDPAIPHLRQHWNTQAVKYNKRPMTDKRFTNGTFDKQARDINEFADDNAFRQAMFPGGDYRTFNIEQFWRTQLQHDSTRHGEASDIQPADSFGGIKQAIVLPDDTGIQEIPKPKPREMVDLADEGDDEKTEPAPKTLGLQIASIRDKLSGIGPGDPHPETKAKPQPAMFEPSSDEDASVVDGGHETHSTDGSAADSSATTDPAEAPAPPVQPAQPPAPGLLQQLVGLLPALPVMFGGGPQPQPAQPQLAPVVVLPAPVVQMPGLREQQAWEKWKKRHHSKAVQAYIRNNQEQRFFKFNDHLNRIEPTYRREHILRNVRVRGKLKREEVHRLRTHPLQDSYNDSKRAFEQKDPLASSSKYAEAASIGEYIKLELMPAVIYIKILKHVQIPALRILARQLFAHCQRGETRVHLKQSRRTGKFNYGVWLKAKQLREMSEEEFYQRLMGITKNGKKTVTLMVKQNIQKGSIHLLWENQHSLL